MTALSAAVVSIQGQVVWKVVCDKLGLKFNLSLISLVIECILVLTFWGVLPMWDNTGGNLLTIKTVCKASKLNKKLLANL